jgi:Flp pilus assembly protein TadB
MQPLLVTLVACVAAVVLYPPAALAIFVLGAIVTGWATWGKARARRHQDADR